jgi:DNA-binding transcriptional LysR family regulator
MKIDIDGIQAFVLVAELGGFHQAAEKLHISQTALSRRVQKLERYLGLKLLDRTTRSVALTSVGRDFFPRALRLVDDLSGSIARLKDMSRTASGDVVVACVPTMAYQQLPSVIRAYAARYPANRVRVLDRSGVQVVDAVRAGEAELGIGLKLARNPDLVEQTILRDPFVLYCHKDHPASRRAALSWKALAELDLIAISGTSMNRALLDHRLQRHGIALRGRFEVEHPSTAISLVAAGVGAAVLPAATLLRGSFPDVRRVALEHPLISRTIVQFVKRGVTLSPAAEAFHALLRRTIVSAGAGSNDGRRASRDLVVSRNRSDGRD